MKMAMKEKEKWSKNGWKELTISPGVLLDFFGTGVPPSSPNSDPISDQKMSLFTPVFRPDL